MPLPAAAAEPGHDFTSARFFGAPAALAFYVINGWLLGVGRTRLALGCQIYQYDHTIEELAAQHPNFHWF